MTARVLIVDDIPTNVRLLEARLSAEYYDVVTASSGPEALAICDSQDIDIVLLDVMMPDMDGPSALAKIREMEAYRTTPAIFMTAKVQPNEIQRYLDMGAVDVIAKPFDPMTLATQISEIWARVQD